MDPTVELHPIFVTKDSIKKGWYITYIHFNIQPFPHDCGTRILSRVRADPCFLGVPSWHVLAHYLRRNITKAVMTYREDESTYGYEENYLLTGRFAKFIAAKEIKTTGNHGDYAFNVGLIERSNFSVDDFVIPPYKAVKWLDGKPAVVSIFDGLSYLNRWDADWKKYDK